MDNITLKFSTPSKTIRNDEVYRVVLPSSKAPLTIIKGRAPTSIFFKQGIVSVLDKNDKPTDRYFVMEGVADINNDLCNLSSELVIPFNEITISEAKEKTETSTEENLKEFYNMIYITLSNEK